MFKNSMNPGCNCCTTVTPPCNGSLTVSVFQSCGGLLTGVTVTIQFGTTTLTLTAPNVGSNGYRFTSTTLSGWSDGTIATVTVTQTGKVPAVRTVTLHCSATTLNVFLTPNSTRIRTGGCYPGSWIPMTVEVTGAGVGDGTYTTNSDGTFTVIPISTESTPIYGTFSAYGFTSETLQIDRCIDQQYGLVADADHICCNCSDWPVCLEMTLDGPQGSVTLAYDPSLGGGVHFAGQITATVMAKIATQDPTTGKYFPVCKDAPVEAVAVTFYYEYTCDGQIRMGFYGCTDGTIPCGPAGSTDPNDQFAMQDLGGLGFGYGYTKCDGTDITVASPANVTRGDSQPSTNDSCAPGGFAAHATLLGKYGGLFSVSESCSGGGAAMMAREPGSIEPEAPADPPKPPGLMAMAGNLAKSVVAHVADGARLAPPEVQADRFAICSECPFHDPAAKRCLKCGCVAMDLKRSWASSECPLPEPKWKAV